MRGEQAIRITDLHVCLGGRLVLEEVSLEVQQGEVVAVAGPSGGGKTTLLRAINYLTPFDQGSIQVLDFTLRPGMSERRHARELQALRQSVGMVFQHFHLFPHRTVLENLIEAPCHVLGWPASRAAAEAETWLARLEIAHLRDQYPKNLSGGEQQRVALARALMMEPRVLLLDEPTSALDSARQAVVADIVREFAAGGGSVVMVTHQPPLVQRVADRVAVLQQGRIVATGTPEQVLGNGNLLAEAAVCEEEARVRLPG